MNEDAARVRRLLRQQAAIAKFGSFALGKHDLLAVLAEAARVCADGLGVPFSKICKYRSETEDLLIEAGWGWRDGVVGYVVCRADATTPQGRAFSTGKPSTCNDLSEDHGFDLPSFYAEHGIVSTVDVVIKGPERPYGVLEIDNDQQHDYDQHDIEFLTSFANVLAEAVAASARTRDLAGAVERMTQLANQKQHLLDEKNTLVDELQHRVRNNLQLVYGMLSKEIEDTTDGIGKRSMGAIARRVSTIAQVYENLIGTEMSRKTDFGSYVKTLCLNLAEVEHRSVEGVTLSCESDVLMLDLDVVTALGIIVAELVANSFDHAFPDHTGTATVNLRHAGQGRAVMTIGDNGVGYTSKKEVKWHGIGLVKRLVEQLRGTACVDTLKGTTWTISFPVPVQ